MTQPLTNANYQTVRDFLDDIRDRAENPTNDGIRRMWLSTDATYHGGPDWFGADCKNASDVIKKIEEGWQAGRETVQKAQEQIAKLELVPLDRRRRIRRTDFGDHLDIHAVYTGRLQTAWTIARRRVTQGRQNVSICVNNICSGAERPDVLFWRGAAGVMLSDLLEEHGYASRIVVAFGGELLSGSGKFSCRVIVKDFGAPLDISTASAVLMPGFFRSLGHAWMARTDTKTCGGGMSLPGKPVIEPDEFFCGPEVRDEASAIRWAAEAIKQVNAGGIDDMESVA